MVETRMHGRGAQGVVSGAQMLAPAEAIGRCRPQVTFAGQPISIAADIDALGVVRFDMRAGRRPASMPFGTTGRRTAAPGQRCLPASLTRHAPRWQSWPQADTNSPPRQRQGVEGCRVGTDAGHGSSPGTPAGCRH